MIYPALELPAAAATVAKVFIHTSTSAREREGVIIPVVCRASHNNPRAGAQCEASLPSYGAGHYKDFENGSSLINMLIGATLPVDKEGNLS
jgi:hypothetical protein